MTWINPVTNLVWYSALTPVPAGIIFTQGVYVVSTPTESQNAKTLDQAEQIGHDMVLNESKIVLSLSFRSFFIDEPTDGQQIYVIDLSNVITTGVFALGDQTVTPTDGSPTVGVSSLVGWCATPL